MDSAKFLNFNYFSRKVWQLQLRQQYCREKLPNLQRVICFLIFQFSDNPSHNILRQATFSYKFTFVLL